MNSKGGKKRQTCFDLLAVEVINFVVIGRTVHNTKWKRMVHANVTTGQTNENTKENKDRPQVCDERPFFLLDQHSTRARRHLRVHQVMCRHTVGVRTLLQLLAKLVITLGDIERE